MPEIRKEKLPKRGLFLCPKKKKLNQLAD